MPQRVLTTRELNRALLARQLLSRRARLPVSRAVERVGALQAQWPPSPYVALWTRLVGFDRGQLQRAVESRRVVKSTLMRGTLHLVTASDYLAYAGIFLEGRAARLGRELAKLPGGPDVEQLARDAAAYAAESPRSRPELLELLGLPKLVLDDRRPWVVWHFLTARAQFVHTPPGSVWRKTTGGSSFVPARTWLGADGASGEAAAVQLLRRYLAAFGPATRADAARWTGLAVSALEPAFEQLPLRRFRDVHGRALVDLPRAPLPPAATEAPPRFLPMWDSTLLAHADRSRILPSEYQKTVIRKNGDVQPTFLVDGYVAGTWRLEGERVSLDPFEPLRGDVRRALEGEARALARFHVEAS